MCLSVSRCLFAGKFQTIWSFSRWYRGQSRWVSSDFDFQIGVTVCVDGIFDERLKIVRTWGVGCSHYLNLGRTIRRIFGSSVAAYFLIQILAKRLVTNAWQVDIDSRNIGYLGTSRYFPFKRSWGRLIASTASTWTLNVEGEGWFVRVEIRVEKPCKDAVIIRICIVSSLKCNGPSTPVAHTCTVRFEWKSSGWFALSTNNLPRINFEVRSPEL